MRALRGASEKRPARSSGKNSCCEQTSERVIGRMKKRANEQIVDYVIFPLSAGSNHGGFGTRFGRRDSSFFGAHNWETDQEIGTRKRDQIVAINMI